jgi:hypothetical protein
MQAEETNAFLIKSEIETAEPETEASVHVIISLQFHCNISLRGCREIVEQLL